ncbi:MAG: HAD family hydrolase [Smithella sp.]
MKNKAFQGKIDLHEYHRRIIQLYGITDPNEIEEGIKAIEIDDNCVEIMEDVPETLKALKRQGYLLGIITDTALPISVKLNWFEKYGFGNLWDSIISSKEIGVRKPSPLIYHEALSQMGTKPEEAVFVGHKATELQGACSVGMFTVAFNYEKKSKADFYIDRFSDLLEIPLLTLQGNKK